MPDAYSFGRGTSGPSNITPPKPGTGNGGLVAGLLGARFGGGGMGPGFGMGRLGRGARRKPGLDPYTDPALSELGGGVGPGGEVYDPESLLGVRTGRTGVVATNPGTTSKEPQYDVQGRLTGYKDVTSGGYNMGQSPGSYPGLQGLRGYSAALGSWRGRPGSSGGVNQGAGFGQPEDMIRKLLLARMGGGGL